MSESESDPDPIERAAAIDEATAGSPPVAHGDASPGSRRQAGLTTNALAVWAVLTLAFLAFLAFGSVSIHQWRWSFILDAPQEDIETVRLMKIWTYQADRLPDVAISAVMPALFYGSLFVFVVGSIVAAWLLLARPDDAPTGVDRAPGTQTVN